MRLIDVFSYKSSQENQEKLPKPHFPDYIQLFGSRLEQLIAKTLKEVLAFREDEVVVIACIGTPGAGKTELLKKLKEFFVQKIPQEKMTTITWEAIEMAFRQTLPRDQKDNLFFSASQLVDINTFLIKTFEKLLITNKGQYSIIFLELPIGSGYLNRSSKNTRVLDPNNWGGRVLGDWLIHKITLDNNPSISFKLINCSQGPSLYLADIIRDQKKIADEISEGAPLSVIHTHQALAHASIQAMVDQKRVKIPSYLMEILDLTSRMDIQINPLDVKAFRDKFGDAIQKTIDFTFPSNEFSEWQMPMLTLFARYTALAGCRAIFMKHIIENQFEISPENYSSVMVSPDVAQLGVNAIEAKDAFVKSLQPKKKNIETK